MAVAQDELWIGGRIELGWARDGDLLSLDVWLDPKAGIVAGVVHGRAKKGDLGALLGEACRAPQAGKPRTPRRVIVARAALAAEVRRAGPGIDVVVGPTPELDDLAASFRAHLGMGAETPQAPALNFVGRPWCEGAKEDARRLSQAGAALWKGAPWTKVTDADPIRVEAPTLGLADGVACVVGSFGSQFGFALFARAAHYRTFERLAGTEAYKRGEPKLDADQLMFDVEPTRSKKSLRVEALHMCRNWEAFEADAAECALLAAVAEALAVFDPAAPATTHGGVTLRLLAEPEAMAPVIPLRPKSDAAPSARPGRNDLCWCGSGKKYKKCHLDGDAASAPRSTAAAPSTRTRWGAVLDRMYPRLVAWATANVPGWREHLAAFAPIRATELHQSAALFATVPARGPNATVGEQFRERMGSALAADDRRWLDANIETAWTSYWSVVAVEPGRAITLRDIFSEEVRTVVEGTASRTVVPHDLLCGRVVTIGDESYLDICHPQTLGPEDMVTLRRVVAEALGLTKVKRVPLAKLMTDRVVTGLLMLWQLQLDARERARARTRLQTTDGEELVFVSERYPTRGARAEVARRLEGLEGIEASGPGASEWTLSKQGNAMIAGLDHTSIAAMRFEGAVLVVETKSRERAAKVRALLEGALGDVLGTPQRTEERAADLMAKALAEPRSGRPPLVSVPPPEAQAAILDLKRQTYATWPDEALPALDGKSARQAVKTASGRKRVRALLDEFEHHEARQHPGERFDFGILRRELGLESD